MFDISKSQKRKRGVILSSQGWQRLQVAEHLSALRNNGGRPYTLEQLSAQTELSTNTLTKVRRREKAVDLSTLEVYFHTFGLNVDADDYITQDVDVSTQTHVKLQRTPLQGQLVLNSLFYIYRPPAEQRCLSEILQPGALIRIKAPHQFGKSSLAVRILKQAKEHGFRVAILSLRLADSHVFTNLNQFLQWLCAMVTRLLSMPNRLSEYWNELFGASYSCSDYFERYLLSESESPLLLVLDDVDVAFNYCDITTDFFGLLRTWYEQAKDCIACSEVWQRLRLILVHSSEVYLQFSLHQSPFNVGLVIELFGFTQEQIRELAVRYGLEKTDILAEQLMKFLGGHPYMTQLALFHLNQQEMSWENLIETAILPNGIFNSHIRQQLLNLKTHPTLLDVIHSLASHPEGIKLHPEQAFKLWGMGLIRFHNQLAFPSCELYRQFFTHSELMPEAEG